MNDQIGTWVKREQRETWHLVESLVAHDAITKCGRRMHDEANSRGGLVFSDAPAWSVRCDGCSR
jgi:hypothetical protein